MFHIYKWWREIVRLWWAEHTDRTICAWNHNLCLDLLPGFRFDLTLLCLAQLSTTSFNNCALLPILPSILRTMAFALFTWCCAIGWMSFDFVSWFSFLDCIYTSRAKKKRKMTKTDVWVQFSKTEKFRHARPLGWVNYQMRNYLTNKVAAEHLNICIYLNVAFRMCDGNRKWNIWFCANFWYSCVLSKCSRRDCPRQLFLYRLFSPFVLCSSEFEEYNRKCFELMRM